MNSTAILHVFLSFAGLLWGDPRDCPDPTNRTDAGCDGGLASVSAVVRRHGAGSTADERDFHVPKLDRENRFVQMAPAGLAVNRLVSRERFGWRAFYAPPYFFANSFHQVEGLRTDEFRGVVSNLDLPPCGWKTQQQLWARNGMETEWPVEVNAGLLFRVTTTRFNRDSAVPRIVSAFQRDWITYSLALALALTPIPLTLFARNFVSLYDIPSASMEPTLMKGDVLLVEKFPGVYRRTQRGDVVLFKPPSALREIVLNSGSQLSSTSLFVKRLAGVPGDESLRLTDDGTVLIDGKNAVGPDRNQCADEPLRLIDKLLENGKGKEVERLGDDDTYVLGDCKAVSVDSRVFGILPKENIVGKPLARIWPLNRIKLSGPF